MKRIIILIAISFVLLASGCETTTSSTWTITFDSNGGSAVDALEIEAAETIALPNDPVKEGFVFDGWYTDSSLDTSLSITEMPPMDFTLYAKWVSADNDTATTITVTYNSMGGSNVPSLVYLIGSMMVTPTDPVRTGFSFVGWSSSSSCSSMYSFGRAPNSNITLFACWTSNDPDLVTISFDSTGGSVIEPITGEAGTTIDPPTDPTRENATFDRWYVDGALTTPFVFDIMPETDTTLYAKWIVDDSVIVTFDTDGGNQIAPITIASGDTLLEPGIPSKTDYIFVGWYTSSARTERFEFDTPITTDTTLYAKWVTFESQHYQVTFVTNSTEASIAPIWVANGESFAAPVDPTKTDYDFMGWYTDEDVIFPYTFGSIHNEDITLYAKWEATVVTYGIILFTTNGAPSIDRFYYPVGTPITAPIISKYGYTFDGWYTDPSLTNEFLFDTMPEGVIQLFAKWVSDNQGVTLTFDMGDGPSKESYNAVAGRTITTILSDIPTYPGYVFDGWYVDSSHTTLFTATTMPSTAQTIYAKWTYVGATGTAKQTLIDLLLTWDFTCNNGICEYEEYSDYLYIFNFNTLVFTYDISSVDDEDGGYRYYDRTTTIYSDWTFDYVLSIDENYGVSLYTDMTMNGNVKTDTYNVISFRSNTSQRNDVEEHGIVFIEGLELFLDSLFETAGVTMDDLT